MQESIFEKLFTTAEIAKFTPDQVQSYEDSLKYYRDLKNSLDTAREEGVEEGFEMGLEKGIEQGIINTAKNAIKQGLSDEVIMSITGLNAPQINQLK